MRIGIITYDFAHLKTEQLVSRYVSNTRIKKINLYTLPYLHRKKRKTLIQHRPDMSTGLHPEKLAKHKKVNIEKWDGKRNISSHCDVFIIAGSGILDISFASGKPIINAHPGIIPITRGLDSFKWAIYNGDPLGNTLHVINQEIDKGEIIEIRYTPVFSTDTINTLADRHYENEIEMLSNVLDMIDIRISPKKLVKPAKLRMSNNFEASLLEKFNLWKSKYQSEVHDTAIIDNGSGIGLGCRIWHWVHICSGAKLGSNITLGQNVFVANNVIIGDGCKIQNNVSIYDNIILEEAVFCGPSMVFTNVYNPRSLIDRKESYLPTLIKKGATLGANCTIICGVTIGEYAFIGAGAVVNVDVKPYALMVGVAAKQIGWMSEFGEQLDIPLTGNAEVNCANTGDKYILNNGTLYKE